VVTVLLLAHLLPREVVEVSNSRTASPGLRHDPTFHADGSVPSNRPEARLRRDDDRNLCRIAVIHPRLSVSAISSYALTFEQDLELWAELGIRSVGLYLPKLDAAGLDHAVEQVRAAELAVSTIACRGFALSQPDTWAQRRVALDVAVDAAAAVGAACLFVTAGSPGPLGWDDCVEALGAALGPVRDRATARGVAIAIENSNPMRRDVAFVQTLQDSVDVARAHDVGVVVEITNCWSDRDIDRVIADGIDTFRVVQVSDYVVGDLRASERAVPGDGDIPLGRLLGVVADAGFDGYYELEMLGPRIEQEGYRSAISRALVALEPLLQG
jgi:sugar phosphate isomerase/epimerase